MKKIRWLTKAMVVAIHDEAIFEFGGLAGVRDEGLLESALHRPRNKLAYQPDLNIFALAASLCFGITSNHPFFDGNKRTALLATRAFIFINGYDFEPMEHDEVITMIDLAAKRIDELALESWLRNNSTRSRKETS